MLDIKGGTFSGSGGTVIGNTAIGTAAVLAPGTSAGVMTFDGDLTLADTSTTEIEIGGTGTTEFDRLIITGDATLAGTLELSLFDGYRPEGGETFEIIAYGSHTDEFDAVTGLEYDGYGYFKVDTGINNRSNIEFNVNSICN